MRGVGVIEDGYAFTEAEIDRASPRFWWGARKRAAYDRVLARRGSARRTEDREDTDDADTGGQGSDFTPGLAVATAAGAAYAMSDTEEKRTESGSSFGSWFGGGSDSGSSSSSDSSSSSSSDSGSSSSSDSGGSSSSE